MWPWVGLVLLAQVEREEQMGQRALEVLQVQVQVEREVQLLRIGVSQAHVTSSGVGAYVVQQEVPL